MSEGIYTRPEPTEDTYETLTVSDPGNTAQHGGSEELKENRYKPATVCLGLLCVILLAVITGVVIHNANLTKHKNDLQSRYDNMTKYKNDLQSRYDELKSGYDNLTEHNVDLQSRLDDQNEQKSKEKKCENGWQTVDGLCYYISTETKTWDESRQYCKGKQSDLIVINSKEKQDFVNRVVRSNQRVWLGLTDRETEGRFKWVDETPLAWGTGEPNDNYYLEQDCVEFWNRPENIGWNDAQCSDRKHWVCERRLQ